MRAREKIGNTPDPAVIALMALGWVLQDERRAQRLLDLTGLSPEMLRERADDPVILAAILSFLESHEPDLVACADSLGLAPEMIVNAHRELHS
ncbi:MAG: DUF3572 domain-containing protein [Sphingobium sp.]